MSTAETFAFISVDDYLAGELESPTKHEYVGGIVYAMAGASNAHNDVVGNAFVAMQTRLRGKPCRAYNSDTKIRVQLPTQVRFYHPDVSVVCHRNPRQDSFQDEPVVIVEVLSRSTRRIDQGEKKDAYLSLPSLAVYILVDIEKPAALVYRRTEAHFIYESYLGMSSTIPLPEIDCELPFAELYEAVEFEAEPNDATV